MYLYTLLNILSKGIFETFLLLYSVNTTLHNKYARNTRAFLLSTLQSHVQMLYTFCPEGFENAT